MSPGAYSRLFDPVTRRGVPCPPTHTRRLSSSPTSTSGLPGFLFSAEGWPYLLVPFIPVAVVLEFAHAGPTWVFLASALGVIPTAALMGRATEELAARSGPGIGGLLNVTFGNAPELIIALFALGEGLHEVVKASLIGSILGNILLVLGASMLVGGLGRDRQNFDRTAARRRPDAPAGRRRADHARGLRAGEGRGLPLPGDRAVDYPPRSRPCRSAVALVLLLTYVAGLCSP